MKTSFPTPPAFHAGVGVDASDAELMSRLAAGDDLALNSLMTRWSGRVIARNVRQPESPSEAREISW